MKKEEGDDAHTQFFDSSGIWSLSLHLFLRRMASKKPPITLDHPVRGAKGFKSQGGTVYSKAIIYIEDPLPEKDGEKRFHLVNIVDLYVKPKYFVENLTADMRRDQLHLGLYEPERYVRIFAKVQRGELILRPYVDDNIKIHSYVTSEKLYVSIIKYISFHSCNH